jgi:hypothetical protein
MTTLVVLFLRLQSRDGPDDYPFGWRHKKSRDV